MSYERPLAIAAESASLAATHALTGEVRRTDFRRSARKYTSAFAVTLRAQFAYPAELWARTTFIFLIMFVFSALWHATYRGTGSTEVGGLTLAQMLWYLAIAEAIILSRPRGNIRLDEEVRTGALAYELARPMNLLLYRWVQLMADRLPKLLAAILVGGPLATLFAGGLGVSLQGLAAGLPVLALALSIDLLIVLALGLAAFWVEDTTSLLFIYDRCLMILGGMMLPLQIFPGWLELTARVLPFHTVVWAPAQAFVNPDPATLGRVLLVQAGWLVAVLALTLAVFAAGTRRLETNGG